MSIRIPVSVEMDDGRTIRVVCDQRDYAAVEGADITHATAHTWVRYIAFSALTRTKQYSGSWEQFNTMDCVEATDVIREESDDAEDGLDPGRKAPGDGS